MSWFCTLLRSSGKTIIYTENLCIFVAFPITYKLLRVIAVAKGVNTEKLVGGVQKPALNI